MDDRLAVAGNWQPRGELTGKLQNRMATNSSTLPQKEHFAGICDEKSNVDSQFDLSDQSFINYLD